MSQQHEFSVYNTKNGEISLANALKLIQGSSDLKGAFEVAEKLSKWTAACCPGLFGPKGVLIKQTISGATKLGEKAFSKLDEIFNVIEGPARYDRIAAGYAMILLAAYFETFQTTHEELWNKIGLQLNEETALATQATEPLLRLGENSRQLNLPLPSFGKQGLIVEVSELYEAISAGLIAFCSGLSLSPKLQQELRVIQQKQFIGAALKTFIGMYSRAAAKAPELQIWASLHKEEIVSRNWDAPELELVIRKSVLNRSLASQLAAPLTDELNRLYRSELDSTIFEHEAARDTDNIAIVYPSIRDFFTPQAYRATSYSHDAKPALESFWSRFAVQEDILGFFQNVLATTHSRQNDYLVLGDPGSGKSVLSRYLCAVASSEQVQTVYIPLRRFQAGKDIAELVSDALTASLSRTLDYGDFAENNQSRTIIFVFDGFDELLQLTGQQHADFLSKVSAFTSRERRQGRDVIAITTSRIALIGLASIPPATTVVKLEHFDKDRARRCVTQWDTVNQGIISKFAPAIATQTGLSVEIEALCKQPFLLALVLLYVTERAKSSTLELNNSGSILAGLSSSVLYERIIHHYVHRELMREPQHSNMPIQDRDRAEYAAIEDLGRVAASMFMRGKFYLEAEELGVDVAFLKSQRGTRYDQMELANKLLRQFFFAQIPRTVRRSLSGDEQTVLGFQFLHDSFREFLLGRHLALLIITDSRSVADRSKSSDIYTDPNRASRELTAILASQQLGRRPEIVLAFKEVVFQRIVTVPKEIDYFVSELLKCYCDLDRANISFIPEVMTHLSTCFERSVVGNYAVFTQNLVLLAAHMNSNVEFLASASSFWNRLCYLWAVGLGSADAGLASVFISVKHNCVQASIAPGTRGFLSGQAFDWQESELLQFRFLGMLVEPGVSELSSIVGAFGIPFDRGGSGLMAYLFDRMSGQINLRTSSGATLALVNLLSFSFVAGILSGISLDENQRGEKVVVDCLRDFSEILSGLLIEIDDGLSPSFARPRTKKESTLSMEQNESLVRILGQHSRFRSRISVRDEMGLNYAYTMLERLIGLSGTTDEILRKLDLIFNPVLDLDRFVEP